MECSARQGYGLLRYRSGKTSNPGLGGIYSCQSTRPVNMAEPRHRLLTSMQIPKGHKGLEQGHRARPGRYSCLSNLGNVYSEIGDDNQALFNHTKALKIAQLVQDYSGNGLKTLYSNRGFDYTRLGREERAISDCDEVIKLEPESSFSYVNRAVAYLFLGKDENAQQDMDRAEELGMDHEVIRAAFEKAKRIRHI